MLASKLTCLNAANPKFCCEYKQSPELNLDFEPSPRPGDHVSLQQPGGDCEAVQDCSQQDSNSATFKGPRAAPVQLGLRQPSVQNEHEAVQPEATFSPAPFRDKITVLDPVLPPRESGSPSPLADAIVARRGDFFASSDTSNVELNAETLQVLERLVAHLAGSPLGCIDFARAFTSRQREGQILALHAESLEGMTFGEACQTFSRVTALGIKEHDGMVIWGPAPEVTIKKTDGLLVMACTPFVLAMGLSSEAKSLAEVNLHPDNQYLPARPNAPVLQDRTSSGSAASDVGSVPDSARPQDSARAQGGPPFPPHHEAPPRPYSSRSCCG